jgi:hypothetical protein
VSLLGEACKAEAGLLAFTATSGATLLQSLSADKCLCLSSLLHPSHLPTLMTLSSPT